MHGPRLHLWPLQGRPECQKLDNGPGTDGHREARVHPGQSNQRASGLLNSAQVLATCYLRLGQEHEGHAELSGSRL